MDWTAKPPTKDEIESTSSWADAPPSKDELQGFVSLEPKISKTESALRGAAQGASMGFADEIAGAIEAALSKKTYEQARNESRANFAKAKKENPGSYTSGEVGGGLATAFVPGLNVAKGAGLLKTGIQAAGLGLAGGAGYSEADNVGDLSADALKGAAIGGTIGVAAHAASPYLEKAVSAASKKTSDLANRFAARALGAERGTVKSLGMEKVLGAGRQALDEGLLSPLASTDDVIARNNAVKNQGGKLMEKAYNAIDDAGASTFNPLNVASKVDTELAPTYRTPINKAETNQLENTLESIMARGDGNIPIKQAQALKEEIGAVAFPRGKRPIDPTPKQQMAMDAYKIINQSIDDAVEKGAKAVENAGLSETLKRGKEIFGKAKVSEKLLDNKRAREQGNNIIGLTDAITGAGALGYGGTTGDWDTAGGLFLGRKLLSKYGSQNAALALDKISKALIRSPKMADVYAKNPNVFNTIVRKVEEQFASGAKAADASPKSKDQNADFGASIKGERKWMLDGIAKIGTHDETAISDEALIEKALSSAEGRRLLVAASDLKPGSKAMEDVLSKIKNKFAKGAQ